MSMSNPCHHVNVSNTKRDDEKKNEREWKELQEQKRAYIQRLIEEKEAKQNLRNWDKDDDEEPPF